MGASTVREQISEAISSIDLPVTSTMGQGGGLAINFMGVAKLPLHVIKLGVVNFRLAHILQPLAADFGKHIRAHGQTDDALRRQMGRRALEITIPYFTWAHRTRDLLDDLGLGVDPETDVGAD